MAPMGSVGYNPAYGGIPIAPNVIDTARVAAVGNQSLLPDLFQLGAPLNAWTATQARVPYEANLPDYTGMVSQSSKNIGAMLRGEVPLDVVNQIAGTRGGMSAVTGQRPDSAGFNAAIRAALGRTSLDLMGAGESALTGAMARTPTGPQFNPMAGLVTPEQTQQAQMTANLYTSLPYPAQASEEARRLMLQALGQGVANTSNWGNRVWGNVLSREGTLYG
jgi:hypothetical protein